jgi:hypothetical protein
MKNWIPTSQSDLLFLDIFFCCRSAGLTCKEGIEAISEVINTPVIIMSVVKIFIF